MKPNTMSQQKSSSWAIATVVLAFLPALYLARGAHAQGVDANEILKAMSDYLASQKVISATLNTDIEVITPEIQKIQFASSGRLLLSRPDKLHVSRTGGYANAELIFDGKTATIFGKNINAFSQIDAPGSIDQLVDTLINKYGIEAPRRRPFAVTSV